jgi:hypothetical protein
MQRAGLNSYETGSGKSLLAQIPIAKSRHNAIRADNRQRLFEGLAVSAIHPETLQCEIEGMRIPNQLNERLKIFGCQPCGPRTEAGSPRDGWATLSLNPHSSRSGGAVAAKSKARLEVAWKGGPLA